MNAILTVIITILDVLSWVIIIDALLSFVLSPDHPIRGTFGRILQPIYAPIRRILPPMGMMDFTPLVVLILIRVLEMLLVSIF